MDRLESMKTYIKVVESGSFSAASRLMGVPLPTVSRKVAELETYLGAELLRRTTRKLELTETGMLYMQHCKEILDRLDEAERAAGGEYRAPKGSLHITASTLFGRMHLVPVVAAFLKAYPDIDVRLMLTDRNVNLIEEHLDFAFRIGELADSALMAVRIGSTRYITCASAAYLAKQGTPETLKELAQHACITFEGLSTQSATLWQFQQDRKTLLLPVRSRLAATTADAAIEACLAGIGITRVLEYQIITHLKSKTLKAILIKHEPIARPIHLLYRKSSVPPLKMRAFIDFTVPRLKKTLDNNDSEINYDEFSQPILPDYSQTASRRQDP